MRDLRDGTCFGFFAGENNAQCARCTAARRCKAVLVSDGFDIMGTMVDQLVAELPSALYQNTDRITELVSQLLAPPTQAIAVDKETEELLGLVTDVELDKLSAETI